MKTQHPDKVADEKLECQLCHAKFKQRDKLTFHKRTCHFRTTGKRVATNKIGGSAPKRHQNTRAKWSEQLLQDKFIVNLDEVKQTPEKIIDIFKNSLMDLKPTIEEKLGSSLPCMLPIIKPRTLLPWQTHIQSSKVYLSKFYLPPISTKWYKQSPSKS